MEVITIKDTTIQKEKIVEGKSWLDRDNFFLRAFYVNIQVRYFSFISKNKKKGNRLTITRLRKQGLNTKDVRLSWMN